MKLCGRAGRSGCKARAHLFYPPKKKDNEDNGLRDYVESGENCRRKILLSGLGETFSTISPVCCDVCTPLAIDAHLDILKPGRTQRPHSCKGCQ